MLAQRALYSLWRHCSKMLAYCTTNTTDTGYCTLFGIVHKPEVSRRQTALNATEILWKRKLVSLEPEVTAVMCRPSSHRKDIALSLKGPWNSMAMGTSSCRRDNLMYFVSLRVAADSEALPAEIAVNGRCEIAGCSVRYYRIPDWDNDLPSMGLVSVSQVFYHLSWVKRLVLLLLQW